MSVGFVVAERYATEPLVPLAAVQEPVFSVASVVGFIVGIALFGSVTYLPLYLQVVKGSTPTESGLQMLPLMAGRADRVDRERAADHALRPLQGLPDRRHGADGRRPAAALAPRVGTSMLLADLYMLVVGLGLGFVMQVLVLAVQNAVEYENLGVATSTATLFRSMGGTIGVPLFGAIFSNKLASELAGRLPARCRRRAAGAARAEPDRPAAAGDPRSRTSPRTRRRCGRCS